MNAELLSLLESDPAAGILAVADLREQRAEAATEGPYRARAVERGTEHEVAAGPSAAVWLYIGDDDQDRADAEHIAAEANPAHALAESRLWRTVAHEMETQPERRITGDIPYVWVACVVSVRAYLGGTP